MGGLLGGGTLNNPVGGGLDLQMHRIPIIGSFFGNPAEQQQLQQFDRAARAYDAYRPELEQATLNSLKNSMSAYQGASNVLATMMGGQTGMDPSQMQTTPMGPSMTGQGAPRTSPGDGGTGLGQITDLLGGGGMGGLGGGIPGMGGGGGGGGMPGGGLGSLLLSGAAMNGAKGFLGGKGFGL